MTNAADRQQRTLQRERRPRVPRGPARPETAAGANPVLALQQVVGNQAVQRLLRAPALPAAIVLGQQRTLGNQAVQRLLRRHRPKPGLAATPDEQLVLAADGLAHDSLPAHGRLQRMPTVERLMEVKKKGGTAYQAMTAALTAFRTYIEQTWVGQDPATIDQQIVALNQHYDSIRDRTNDYLNNTKGKTGQFKAKRLAKWCQENILDRLETERALMLMTAYRYRARPPKSQQPWLLFLPTEFENTRERPYKVGQSQQKGTEKGGQKAQKNFGFGDVPEGFLAGESVPDNNVKAALKAYGIDPDNPRLLERSVAMSRLDQLLGADVIAHTRFAKIGDDFGALSEKAAGSQMLGILDQENKRQDDQKIDLADPNLQRLLSRLLLIDAIAGQIDRHANNYFVERDAYGKVIRVTGIDLDQSFVTKEFAVTGALKGGKVPRATARDWYPGLSQFLDKELAERILALAPETLAAILQDLLPPAEIDNAKKRLTKVQSELKKLQSQNKLLDPQDWNDVTALEIEKEQKSYLAHAMNLQAGGSGYRTAYKRPPKPWAPRARPPAPSGSATATTTSTSTTSSAWAPALAKPVNKPGPRFFTGRTKPGSSVQSPPGGSLGQPDTRTTTTTSTITSSDGPSETRLAPPPLEDMLPFMDLSEGEESDQTGDEEEIDPQVLAQIAEMEQVSQDEKREKA